MSQSNLQTIVILSTADFDAPLWTNKQHLAVGLANHFEIIFINSLGLRQPKFNKQDLMRLKQKLHKSKKPINNSRITVLNPWVLPFHNLYLIRIFNNLFMRMFCILKIRNRKNSLLWTFSPVTYGLHSFFAKVVYHSVDLLETFPGISHSLITKSEERLLKSADLVLASSRPIEQKLQKLHPRTVTLFENVADTNVFYNKKSVRSLEAVFAGNLTPSKINLNLFESLAKENLKLTLAGSISIDGTDSIYIQHLLKKYSNISYLGELTPNDLNELFNKCKIGLIPYKLNVHTRGIYPMKVHEYGSAGLTVVSTKLPGLLEFSESKVVKLVEDEDFVDEVVRQLNLFTPELSIASSDFSSLKSWKNRIAQVLELLNHTYES
jgi:hypothetical protein